MNAAEQAAERDAPGPRGRPHLLERAAAYVRGHRKQIRKVEGAVKPPSLFVA